MLSACRVPGKGGGAGNRAVDLKKKKKILPSLWTLHILFGNAERKTVRGPAEITGEIVKNRRGEKMMARRN